MAQSAPGSESPRRRAGLLKDQVQLVNRKDSNRYEIAPIQERLSFEKGFFVVIRACQMLAEKNDGIVLVGLAGPSGAGKTIFTEKILHFMPSVAVISMDNYNEASRIVDGNFDDPRLTDYDTLLQNINDLKAGKEVQVPIYDFKTSSRVGYRTLEAPSSRIVIVEGIYALSEKLRPLLDLRVSVTGGVHFDLVKRVLRDTHRAGNQPEEIIQQISETVYPMYKAFIEPDLQTAHIKIVNKFNPFSGFQNPSYILKSTRRVEEDQIRAVLSREHTEDEEQTSDIYLLPPGEDPESCQSYLRMRNRDGKYNLMFEEWVTDRPFIISPRITFEVSVRLLGGLMTLGYSIAAILKRSSQIFSDDRVTVKIDWLEQLNRFYTQVQGKDRLVVKYVAEQLGLEGSYTSRTYIEQIQLEKLVKEVMPLPEDLKTKLSLDKEIISNPKAPFSRASTDRIGESTAPQENELSEQIATLNDRMDEFTARIEELSSSLTIKMQSPSQQNMTLQSETCNGSTPTSHFISSLSNGSLNIPVLPKSSSSSQLAKDSPLMEEILTIARVQRQITHRMENLTNLLQEKFGEKQRNGPRTTRRKSVITHLEPLRHPAALALALGGFGFCLYKGLWTRN